VELAGRLSASSLETAAAMTGDVAHGLLAARAPPRAELEVVFQLCAGVAGAVGR
jgi:hypothetical protein